MAELVAAHLVLLAVVEGDVDGAVRAAGDARDGAPLGALVDVGPGQDALSQGPDAVAGDAGAGGDGGGVADGVEGHAVISRRGPSPH